jgi:hypothetical protein
VETLASAAAALDACTTVEDAERLAASLGFGHAVELGVAHRERLGLGGTVGKARIASGTGELRALVFETSGDTRTIVEGACRAVVRAAPQFYWLAIAAGSRDGITAIAATDGSVATPRTSALLAARGNITDSDAETLCALAAACRDAPASATHLRWIEILGRDSISRRFYRALEAGIAALAGSIEPSISERDAKDLALLHASRLIFLSFLETKGWLDCDRQFLTNGFSDCMLTGGRYQARVLEPLFFGTLNTRPGKRAARARAFGRIPFLNGGLFGRTPLERRSRAGRFPDEAFGDFFGNVLTRYRFTAREDTRTWSEAAVDPEMLGRAFESLMSPVTRRKTGAFYTPQSLVERVTQSALDQCMAKPDLKAIASLRLLDPACGSGAFLVHALELLSAMRRQLGDPRAIHEIRRDVLVSSIFGVDVNPVAVWICELRLWLSAVIEDPERVPSRVAPLPNLDRNVRAGDSLAGDDFAGRLLETSGAGMRRLRLRYARACGPRKRSLARVLDAAERRSAIASIELAVSRARHERAEILNALRSRDLFGARDATGLEMKRRLAALRGDCRRLRSAARRLRDGGALPFSFVSAFAEVASSGGFDVIVGNPPWVRTHNLDASARSLLRRRFESYRSSAWLAGSMLAGAGRGFASQVDLAALFTERSARLLRPGGVAALIVPSKLWRSLSGGGLRSYLAGGALLLELHDLGSTDRTFDAVAYPSIVVIRRAGLHVDHRNTAGLSANTGTKTRVWRSRRSAIAFDDSPGAPWLLVPPLVRASFDTLRRAGPPLAQSASGRPLLGVKTGLNEAFIVRESGEGRSPQVTVVEGGGRSGEVERDLLRAAAGGEDISRWRVPATSKRIIWTHGDDLRPLRSLPPFASSWLRNSRGRLETRTDLRGTGKWYELFRVESADAFADRVVWPDIARNMRAAVLPAGDPMVPLNSCYAIRSPGSDDAFALVALLNSTVAGAWLRILAEPARGGYRRYMGWTISLLPVPRDWKRARAMLAPLGERAFQGIVPDPDELDAVVRSAYEIAPGALSALLEWDQAAH